MGSGSSFGAVPRCFRDLGASPSCPLALPPAPCAMSSTPSCTQRALPVPLADPWRANSAQIHDVGARGAHGEMLVCWAKRSSAPSTRCPRARKAPTPLSPHGSQGRVTNTTRRANISPPHTSGGFRGSLTCFISSLPHPLPISMLHSGTGT